MTSLTPYRPMMVDPVRPLYLIHFLEYTIPPLSVEVPKKRLVKRLLLQAPAGVTNVTEEDFVCNGSQEPSELS